MNNRDKAIAFIKNEMSEIPFHPLIMQFAAYHAKVKYGDYCTDYKKQVEAMLHCAKHMGCECVHPSGFALCEAEAYGLDVTYPEDALPYSKTHLVNSIDEIDKIKPLDIASHKGMMNRVNAVKHYRETAGDKVFICGHMEGPFAEYADLRGLAEACMDLFDCGQKVKAALRIITDNAKAWAKMQIEAGADCMSIGDAACSTIGPAMYEEFVFEYHKELVEYIHGLGAYVKLHICGNITSLLPMIIETKANIIDVDYMVEIEDYVDKLGKEQVFCGNIDPANVLLKGTPKLIKEAVNEYIHITKGRGIVSAGCEVIIDTPLENFNAMADAVKEYNIKHM